MSSIYRHRDGWQAKVTIKGSSRRKNFASHREAKAWADETATTMRSALEPHLGGPGCVTLAQVLLEYAQHYTVLKKSAKSELDRINRYLLAASLPRLKPVINELGGTQLEVQADTEAALPTAFETHKRQRAAVREATDEYRTQLSNKTVSQLTTVDFRRYITVMSQDGLSPSTVQKEIALIKHAFNVAIQEWHWLGFDNPLTRMKLPKRRPRRDVVMSQEREKRLRSALADCDNPFILPLYDLAVETTARRSSLLRLTWDRIDLEERFVLLWNTKTGENVASPLTQRSVAVLRQLKQTATDARVFPISSNALHQAWKRAMKRAGESDLRFHDARHIGTTRHARRLRNPDLLRLMTGHLSNAMLSHYTHFSCEDAREVLDATEPPPRTPLANEERPSDAKSRMQERLARQAGKPKRKTAQQHVEAELDEQTSDTQEPTGAVMHEGDAALAGNVITVAFGHRRRSA
jgi:integrase